MKGENSVAYVGKGTFAKDLASQLEAEGQSLCMVKRISELARALEREQPGSLIVELAGKENSLTCLDVVSKVLDGARVRPRLLVVSDRADQKIRLKAVQAGSEVFLATPVTSRLILQHLFPVSGRNGERHRVLLIDDAMSDQFADTVSQLKHDGMHVKQLKNPAQALLSMINFMPDLLIIGYSLPGCRSDEIGRMIHQLSDYEDIPVIYLCDEEDKALTPRDACPYEVISTSTEYAEFASRLNRLALAARSRRNRIQYLRNYDQLTGFLNRDGFLALLERGSGDNDEAAVLVLELEKACMSPHLHNELVSGVASLLSRSIPSSMVPARVGDYGFAFLSNGIPRQELKSLGERLRHDICKSMYVTGDTSITVGCNLGIAVADHPLTDGLPLFALAIQACNEAVQSSVNHICIHSLARVVEAAQSSEDRTFAEYLQYAIDENLFRLVYQPIASLHGNGVEKYEVLLRLHDRNGNVFPPSRFMPVAERNGLMHAIDRWVIESAMDVLKKRGNGTSLFVKVSSESIQAPGFSAWLENLFNARGLPGNRLVFEICDANIRAGLKQVADFANHARKLGCGIALEHYDIGRDLEPLLEHISASYVKINRNAVDDIAVSRELQLKLKTMIALCEHHKARVITGFVEDASSLQLLWKCGVHYIQGNFLQEPDEELDFDFG
jgi:EAL domain-containing protein (putative c-di-GMP-specific phosphodiesterase class I)/GGDEF domain-containing protein/DNA-binding response OmpR family regulator